MNTYIYKADLYCESCGEQIRERLQSTAPDDPNDEHTYDSDDYPKGPYPNGGGEADFEHFCAECTEPLNNPVYTPY